jgi:hypothetical protein
MIAGTGLREVRVTHPMRPSDSMVGLVPAALQGRLGQDVEIRPRSRSSRRKARALAGLTKGAEVRGGQPIPERVDWQGRLPKRHGVKGFWQ